MNVVSLACGSEFLRGLGPNLRYLRYIARGDNVHLTMGAPEVAATSSAAVVEVADDAEGDRWKAMADAFDFGGLSDDDDDDGSSGDDREICRTSDLISRRPRRSRAIHTPKRAASYPYDG